MPYSANNFNKTIEDFFKNNPVLRYLDIGAGAGKYGKMLRDLYGDSVEIIALEPWNPYIEEFELNKIYNQVKEIKAIDLLQDVEFETDIVILGDVLEHMRKSDGLDLLHFFNYRCQAIIIQWPTNYLQNTEYGNALEAHISSWNTDSFNDFDVIGKATEGYNNLIIIRGLLANKYGGI